MKTIMTALKKLSKNSPFFRWIARRILYILRSFRYYYYYLTGNTRPRLVIFEAYMGRSFSCSPKALYLAMLDDPAYDSFEFVWAFRNPEDYEFLKLNKNTRLVKYDSGEYFKAYSRAKYWFSNSRIPEQIRPRKDQVYVQTWHGTPLKRLGYDITQEGGNALNSLSEIRKKYDMDVRRYSYMLSPSAFCTEKFKSAFNIKIFHSKNIIIEAGYPRNDFLFKYDDNDVNRVKQALGLPQDKKIILYAPTWRDNQHEAGLGYTYSVGLDFSRLQKELADEYIILFRAHYFVANSFDFTAYHGFVADVSEYDDINELYIISDMLITDYSSVFFDYANLKRPILFYMYDLDFYKNNLREFYIEPDSLPGDILQNEQELLDAIHSLDTYSHYNVRYQNFNRKFNYLDGPDSGKRVLKGIIRQEF
ncbi:MAG: CDP-glycerol glycerophosphotransferase family protein [Oscillospiraceae bacterium]|nr:CDP-glycerol glycerophosphotransferase family protein [Oscillospiraceae bacterium]MDD4414328.1 CDP-glycerol glycerophosphotransferase family protein [Oscillospiraceae bacterium]